MQSSCPNTAGNGGHALFSCAMSRPLSVEEREKPEVQPGRSCTSRFLRRARRTLPRNRHRGLVVLMWNATSTDASGKHPAETVPSRGSATCQRTRAPPRPMMTPPATPPPPRRWRTSFRTISVSTVRSKHRRSNCKRPSSPAIQSAHGMRVSAPW